MLSLIGQKNNSKDIKSAYAITPADPNQWTRKVKKCIQKIFKEKTLDLIVECNIKIIHYLDAIFKLDDDAYKTYKKRNTLNGYTDHAPSVIKQIPKSIATRLSSLH